GYSLYRYRLSEEKNLPFNSDEYLLRILNVEKLKNDPNVFERALQYRDKIKQALVGMFAGKLVSPPENAGSLQKGTANGSNYDLDVILPFKKNGYRNLEEMYYDVYEKVG